MLQANVRRLTMANTNRILVLFDLDFVLHIRSSNQLAASVGLLVYLLGSVWGWGSKVFVCLFSVIFSMFPIHLNVVNSVYHTAAMLPVITFTFKARRKRKNIFPL